MQRKKTWQIHFLVGKDNNASLHTHLCVNTWVTPTRGCQVSAAGDAEPLGITFFHPKSQILHHRSIPAGGGIQHPNRFRLAGKKIFIFYILPVILNFECRSWKQWQTPLAGKILRPPTFFNLSPYVNKTSLRAVAFITKKMDLVQFCVSMLSWVQSSLASILVPQSSITQSSITQSSVPQCSVTQSSGHRYIQ